jgi:osmoprotectant transport system substrate-binding protein
VRKEKKWFRGRMFTAFVVVLALVAAGCGGDDDDDDAGSSDTTGSGSSEECGSVTVGSTNFSEQLIVASMFAQVLEAKGCTVDLQDNLGAREVVYPALASGEIDVIADYVGTLLEFLNEGAGEATGETRASFDALAGYLAEDDLVGLDPSEAEDRNALAVTAETAEEYNLEAVSDLESVAGELIMGGPPECPTRPLCLQGYESVYGLNFKEFKPLDAGGPLTYGALENGDIQVALVFSTQGQLEGDDLVVLEEDKDLQPAENVLPVIRTGVVNETIRAALISVMDALTTEDLISLNKQVDIDLEDAQDVAQAYLEDKELL